MTALIAPQRYVYGGLRIDSELAFTRLTPARRDAAPSDIELSLAAADAAPEHGRQIYQWPGRFEMSLWSSGPDWVFRSAPLGVDALVSADGRRVCCFPQGAGADPLSEFLIRRVLPRIAPMHDRLTLHAALVEGPRGCVMLAGRSGAGKSTLSTALGRMEGWRQLGDDISILAPDGRGVWASAPGAYLTPTSMAGLGFDARDGGADPSHSGKAWFGVGAAAHEPLPIAGLVFLNRRAEVETPRLFPVARTEALASLRGQFIRFDPSNRAAETQLFRSFGRVVDAIDCYRLEYPSDYAALPAVGAELEKAGAPAWAA